MTMLGVIKNVEEPTDWVNWCVQRKRIPGEASGLCDDGVGRKLGELC